jgi:hypothetical protein
MIRKSSQRTKRQAEPRQNADGIVEKQIVGFFAAGSAIGFVPSRRAFLISIKPAKSPDKQSSMIHIFTWLAGANIRDFLNIMGTRPAKVLSIYRQRSTVFHQITLSHSLKVILAHSRRCHQ